MSDQLALFTAPEARTTDPATSHEAAAKVKPSHQQRLVRIAEIVDEAGRYGATADEIWQRVSLEEGKVATRSTWHRAVSSAADEGLILPTGEKKVRLSIYNCVMRVYVTPRWLP